MTKIIKVFSIVCLAVFISTAFIFPYGSGNLAKADSVSKDNPVPIVTDTYREPEASTQPNYNILNILASNFLTSLINSIFPQSVPKGSKSITIIVNGDSFIPNLDSTNSGSVIYFNGKPLPTNYNSSNQLTAQVDDTYLTNIQNYEVKVVNPAPGGGVSNTVTFSIDSSNPNPMVSTISPVSVPLNSSDFILTVNGSNFIQSTNNIPNSGSIIYFNNVPMIPTTYVSSTQLTAKIPALYSSTVGIYNVMVVNPYPGGGPSNPTTFTVIDTGSPQDTTTPPITTPPTTPEPPITPTPTPPTPPTTNPPPKPTANFNQIHFRIYQDNGSLNTATPYAPEDANYNTPLNVIFRIRFEVANTGNATGNIQRRLEFKEDTGAWTRITTNSNNIRLADSTGIADGSGTTSRLTPTGTFVSGRGKDTSSEASQFPLLANNYVEDEYAVKFQSTAVNHSYQFRITNQGTPLNNYTKIPLITPTKPVVVCKPNWQCTTWSACSDLEQNNNPQQIRTCTDTNKCEVSTGKPATTQTCVMPKPHINALQPNSGKGGIKIDILGTSFTHQNNSVSFVRGSTRSLYQNLSSSDGKTIQFTIPTYNTPACAYSKIPCPFVLIPITPGAYSISITNLYGASNEAKFIVNPK